MLVLLAVVIAVCERKSGKITLGPGQGEAKVYTGWRPRKAKIKFCKCHPVPGCSQLEDKAEVKELVDDGFIIEYDIQSGPRTIKWRAWKAHKVKKPKKPKKSKKHKKHGK
jgi:hypothetical protein